MEGSVPQTTLSFTDLLCGLTESLKADTYSWHPPRVKGYRSKSVNSKKHIGENLIWFCYRITVLPKFIC
jgi:hypothetical protein